MSELEPNKELFMEGVLAIVDLRNKPEEVATDNVRIIDQMIDHIHGNKPEGHAFAKRISRRINGLPDAATVHELKARNAALDYKDLIVREGVELKIDSFLDEIFKRDPGYTTEQRRIITYLAIPETAPDA